jgi:DUF1707 SHOCT-like domain
MTAGRYQHMRASSGDRERTIHVLQKSFAEGRLTRDELDDRLGQALVARSFHELMAIVADLPAGPVGRPPGPPAIPPFPTRQPALAPLVAALIWLALVSIAVWAIVTI